MKSKLVLATAALQLQVPDAPLFVTIYRSMKTGLVRSTPQFHSRSPVVFIRRVQYDKDEIAMFPFLFIKEVFMI